MATGTGNLPNPAMSFSPFAILTAEEVNNLVENIESLATGTGIGDSSVIFKSQHIELHSYMYSSITQGNWAPMGATLSEQPYNEYIWNFGLVLNDRINYLANFSGGTYTFRMKFDSNRDRGTATILIDGVSVGTIDTYSPSSIVNKIGTITGITIASGGHTISIISASKNSSSTGYGIALGQMAFWRTN